CLAPPEDSPRSPSRGVWHRRRAPSEESPAESGRRDSPAVTRFPALPARAGRPGHGTLHPVSGHAVLYPRASSRRARNEVVGTSFGPVFPVAYVASRG